MKKLIQKIAKQFGYEIRKYYPGNDGNLKIQYLLSYYNIDIVLDVGASIGVYAKRLRLEGYKGNIVSFEPLSSARVKLEKLNQGDPLWIVAPQCAIGDYDGEVDINIASNSSSSSILEMEETHVQSNSKSAYVGSEKVKIAKLDSIASDYIKDSTSVYLKIDTQGYEEKVLNGAKEVLSKVKVIQTELSLVPLYNGQILLIEMISKLQEMGYELYSLDPIFSNQKTGQLLQVDGLFVKN